MRVVTKALARKLIKREFGVAATKLEDTGRNRQHPCFEQAVGNIRVCVTNDNSLCDRPYGDENENKIVQLSAYFEQSGQWVNQYFFADTLELAPAITDLNLHEALYERCHYPDGTIEALRRMEAEAKRELRAGKPQQKSKELVR